MENLDFKYHPDVDDDYLCPDIMIVCDRKHLKGGSYSGVPKFIAETQSRRAIPQSRGTERKRKTFMNRQELKNIGLFLRLDH